MNKAGLVWGISLCLVSVLLGLHIWDSGKDTIFFCHEHYSNESFMNTMVGDSPAYPLGCEPEWSYSWGIGTCNETCHSNFEQCLEINATKEQVRFHDDCGDFGKDWLIIVGLAFCTGMIISFITLTVFAYKQR